MVKPLTILDVLVGSFQPFSGWVKHDKHAGELKTVMTLYLAPQFFGAYNDRSNDETSAIPSCINRKQSGLHDPG